MEIKTIGVVGAGQMGNGIAQVAAQAGLNVNLTDVSGAALAKAEETIRGSLGRLVKKEKLTAEAAAAAMGRIAFSTDTASHGEAGIIIEAATENVALKYKIFEGLSRVAAQEGSAPLRLWSSGMW